MSEQVVVTGLGIISPVGNDVPSAWEALTAGRSGVARITLFDPSPLATQFAGEVKGFDPREHFDRKEMRRLDRFAQFALVAAREAVEDAGLVVEDERPERIGAVVGTGIGGVNTLIAQAKVYDERGPRRVNPFFIPMALPDTAGAEIAIRMGIMGPNIAVTSACATGTNTIGEAAAIIRRGDADVMLCGGSEAALLPFVIAGFNVMQALSTRNDEPEKASRPFDAERNGFVMGEGAGVLVVESLEHAQARGARIYAEVIGYGTGVDAYHMAAPPEDGRGAIRAMRMALDSAGIAPEEVDYINAHGTSTALNDKTETMAIKAVFGDHAYRLAVSSVKSMTGHLLGASGAVEAIATIKALETGVIPPTINYEHPDPECDLDYVPNVARKAPIRVAMSNNFGLGGHNASIIFRKM